jgi:dephospho-CoA kinase
MLMPPPRGKQRRVRVIGLTGGTGSGKSEAARVFEAMGIPVLDADRIGHSVIAPGGSAEREVAEAFGPAVLSDGHIDRGKLGARVFADPAARALLNQIVHPKIGETIDRELEALDAAGRPLAVIDAALLGEEGKLDPGLDGLVVIQSCRETRLRRLMESRGFSEAQARARMNAQTPPESKEAMAGWVVPNEGTLDAFRDRVRRLGEELVADAVRNSKMPEVR